MNDKLRSLADNARQRVQEYRYKEAAKSVASSWRVWLVVGFLFSPTILGGILSVAFGGEFVYFAPLLDLNFWKPKFHLIFWMFYTTPVLWVYPLGLVGVWGLSRIVRRVAPEESTLSRVAYALVVLVGIWLAVSMLWTMFMAGAYANETMAATHAPQMQETDQIPKVSDDDPRIATRSYAESLANAQFRDNQFRVGGSDDITYLQTENGTTKAYWSYPREPDTFAKKYFGSQRGAVYVPMDIRADEGGELRVVEDTMNYGFGVSVTDNFRWQIYHQQPYTEKISDPFMLTQDGETYILAPKKSVDYHVALTPPDGGMMPPLLTVYTTPTFEGVDVVHEDGEITRVSPDEVDNHDLTSDQNVVPTSVAQKWVMSLKWAGDNGWWSINFDNEEDYQLANMPSSGNSQPFTVKTEDGGVTYLFAMGPSGQGSGVYRIYSVDAQSGDITRHNVASADSTLTGPARASDFVDQLTPEWFGGDSQFEKSEPLPIVRDGELFWMFRVVGGNGDGAITGVAFVSADDPQNRAVMYKDTGAAVSFTAGNYPAPYAGSLAGEEPSQTAQPTGGTITTTNQTVTVVVQEDTDGDGVLETVSETTVQGDWSVGVETNATNSTDTATDNEDE